jgi:hypothetical protein
MSHVHSRCEECGYDLAGAPEAGPHTCPECGTPFDPARPWSPQPWPGLAPRLFGLCGPTIVVSGAFLAAGFAPEIRNVVVWPLWLPWDLALLMAAVAWPWGRARLIALASLPRRERSRIARSTAVAAVFLNAGIIAIALFAFVAML